VSDDGMTTDPTETDLEPDPRGGRIVRGAVAIFFGLLFAWALYQAISNAVLVPGFYDALGLGDQVPWWLLIVSIAVPPALYVGALLVARRLALFGQALVFLVALAASYALWLSIVSLAPLLVA
jgi:hypothetical protein